MSAAHDTALHGEARAANFLGAMFAALSKEIETLWDHHARKMESSLARQSPAIEHADMHRETRLLASVPELIESMRLRAAAIKESHDAASQEAPIEALQRDVRDASEQPRSHARQEHAHNHSVSHACDKRSPPHQKQELLADPIFQISEIDLCALIGRASGNDIVPSPKKIADIAADLELRSAAAAESARFKIRTNAILKAFLDRLLRLTRTGSVEFSAIAAGSGSAAFGAQVFSLPESETDLRAQIEAESQKFQRSCTQIAYLKDLLEHVMRESEEQRTAYLHEVIALRDQINKAENFGRGKSGQAAQSVPHFLQNHLNKLFGDPLGMPDNMELQLSDTGQPGQLLDEEHQVFDSRQIVVIDIAEEAEQDSNTQKELSAERRSRAAKELEKRQRDKLLHTMEPVEL
nr:hypothetical protein HK105_004919 [Polyrhizophydium stewartii]